MRVFAVALDGPLAEYSRGLHNYLSDIYTDTEPDLTKAPLNDRWFVEADEMERHVNDFVNSAMQINKLKCNREAADEMSRWSMGGMVPSILADRKCETRMVTELWLSQNFVPYSNLLFEVFGDEPALCRHIDADFYVDWDIWAAADVAMTGIKSYVVRDVFNESFMYMADGLRKSLNVLDGMMTIVNSFEEIRVLEGIRG